MKSIVTGIAVAPGPLHRRPGTPVGVRVDRAAAGDGSARQIELTDAIHRELGAVAAPTVHPGARGSWRVVMAVPVDRPETLGALVRITDRVISRAERAAGRRVEIALTSMPEREAA